MEMASCARASVGCPPCRGQSRALLYKAYSLRLSQGSRESSKLKPSGSCAAESNPSSSSERSTFFDRSFKQVFPNPAIRTDKSTCCAVDGNSTSSSSSTTADADPPSTDKEQEEGSVAEYEEPESVGKVLSQIKQERLVSGQESPSKTEDFWRGVLEEIQLIEWPSLQKVLGTTGVVTGIIIGSLLVLLTVNALLAQLSDAVFNTPPPA
ncbi:hypothetical protein L7F22_022991 [Adiantum nelumboides]|nr:hypothetical protein [Adiantum nelumboides]